jgi:PPM family protein phosphatase
VDTRIRYAAKTDVGLKRDHNEDCLGVFEADNLFIVADGMGGHASGEIAANVAVEILSEFVREKRGDRLAVEERLAQGVELANAKIHEAAKSSAMLYGMGTTIVALMVEADQAFVAHCGDSRVYRLRGGELARLTKDHSLLQDYIDAMGGLSEEEQKQFPQRNVLTRAVGVKDKLEVARMRTDLLPGDRLLLCSDGLHGMIDEATLEQLLGAEQDLEQLVAKLIECANQAGGSDNITAVVVERLA